MIDETYLFNEEKLPLKDHRFFRNFRIFQRNMRACSFYSKRAIASQYLGRRQLSQVFSAGGHGQAISRDHRAET